MKLIITLIGFISCLNVAAQSKYFEKSFGWTNVQQGHKVAYINDTTYLIVGRQLSATDNLARSFGLLINQYGVEIQLDVYPSNDDEQQYAADMVTTKTGFAIGSCLEHIENQCTSSLILLNQEGIYQKIEILGNMDFNNGARTILKGENDNLLLGGHIIKSTFWETYLIKTDSEGNKLWEKTYSLNPSHSHTIRDILPAEGGGYYLLIITNLNFNTNPESGDIMIMKIDEEGEKEWDKVYNLGEVDQAWRLVSTIDGGFVLGGVVGSGNAVIIKLDMNFEVDWITEGVFPYCGINTLLQLEDGNYVAVGCYETESGETGNDVKLVKLDGSGQVLWERAYGGDRHDYAYDMIRLEDGSFLISGRIESIPNPPGANVYLIKTNCLGLLTEPLTSFSAEQNSEQPLTYHFTNHSQYVYPDSIDGGHFLWDFGDGTTSEELHPSHTFANKGDSYIVTLTAVVCSDSSIMDIKIIAGEEIVGIGEIEGLPAFSFKLYPNPVSDGQLRVEYDLPKEGRLELYDLQGRLMVNCQLLMVNAEVELGLEDLDSGMYLYRLVSEGRTLKGGKLVVED